MSIQVFGRWRYVAGLIFPNFLKEHIAFVFKGWWSASWRKRRYIPLKWETLIQWQSVISQKTWTFKNCGNLKSHTWGVSKHVVIVGLRIQLIHFPQNPQYKWLLYTPQLPFLIDHLIVNMRFHLYMNQSYTSNSLQ